MKNQSKLTKEGGSDAYVKWNKSNGNISRIF